MSLNFKEILSTDSENSRLDKINYNFDQLVANGLGLMGVQGATGSAGATGPTGSTGPAGIVGDVGGVGPIGFGKYSLNAGTPVPVGSSSGYVWEDTTTTNFQLSGLDTTVYTIDLNSAAGANATGTMPGLIRIGYKHDSAPSSDDSAQFTVNRRNADPYKDNLRLTETTTSGYYYMRMNSDSFESGFNPGSNNRIDLKFDAIEAYSTAGGANPILKVSGASELVDINTLNLNFEKDVHLSDNTKFTNSGTIVQNNIITAAGTDGKISYANPITFGIRPPIGTILPILTDIFESVSGLYPNGNGSIANPDTPVASGDFFWHEQIISESGIETLTITNPGSSYVTIPTVTISTQNGNAFSSTYPTNGTLIDNLYHNWTGGQAYIVGDEVLASNGIIYVCDVAGTSVAAAADQPSHVTGSAVETGGTVSWAFLGILATATVGISNGIISSVNLIEPGANYTTANNPVITITGGSGSNGAISAVLTPTGPLRLKTGRGKVGKGYDGWYICNGMTWTNGLESTTAWAQATAYSLGDKIKNINGDVYECVVAGTSGNTAGGVDQPSHTGTTDVEDTNSPSVPNLKWKYIDSAFAYQTEDMCSFGINVEAGATQTAGTIFAKDPSIMAGSQSYTNVVWDGAAYDVDLSLDTSDLRTGISNNTNGPNGSVDGTGNPPSIHDVKRIYRATYIVYLGKTNLYYQVDDGTAGGNVTAMQSPSVYSLRCSNTYVGMINGSGSGSYVSNKTVYQNSTNPGVLDYENPLYTTTQINNSQSYADSGYYGFPRTDSWSGGTAYLVGDFVSYGSFLYRCVVSGTSGSSPSDAPSGSGWGYEIEDTNSPSSPNLRWAFYATAPQVIEEYGYWDKLIGKWTDNGDAPEMEEFPVTMAWEQGGGTYTSICGAVNSGTYAYGVPMWQDISGRDKILDVMTIQDGGSGNNGGAAGTNLTNILQIGKRWITATVYKKWEEVQHGGNLYINVGTDAVSGTGTTSGANAPTHTSGIVRDGASSGIYWKYIGTSGVVKVDTDSTGKIINIKITTAGSGYGKRPKVYLGSSGLGYNALLNTQPSAAGTYYAHIETRNLVRRIYQGNPTGGGQYGVISSPLATMLTQLPIMKDVDGHIGLWEGHGPDWNPTTIWHQILGGAILQSGSTTPDTKPCNRDDCVCPGTATECDGVYDASWNTNWNGNPGKNPPWQTCTGTDSCATPMSIANGFYSYYPDRASWQQDMCQGCTSTDTPSNFYANLHLWATSPVGWTTVNTASPPLGNSGVVNGTPSHYGLDAANDMVHINNNLGAFHNYVHQFSSEFNLWDPIYRDPQATEYAPSGWYQSTPTAGGFWPIQSSGTIMNQLSDYTAPVRQWDAELGKWIGAIYDGKDCLSIADLTVSAKPCNENFAGGAAANYTDSSGMLNTTAYTNLTPAQVIAGTALLDDTTQWYSTPLTLEPTTWTYYIWDNTAGGEQQNANGGSGFSNTNLTKMWRLWDSNNSYTAGNVPGWAGLKHECRRGGAGASGSVSLAYDLPWLIYSAVAFTSETNTQSNGVDPMPCIQSGGWSSGYGYQRADSSKNGTNWVINAPLNTVLEPATLQFATPGSTQFAINPFSYHNTNYTSNQFGYSGLGMEQHHNANFYMMPNDSDTVDYNTNSNDYWGLWNGTEWGAVGQCSAVGCTLENTMIQKHDGTDARVQDIKVGDKLKTMSSPLVPQTDNTTSLWKFKHEGDLVFDNVITTVVKNEIYVVDHIYIFILNGGYTLKTSWDHTNLIKRHGVWKFMQSKFIANGDIMMDSTNTERTITEVQVEKGTFNTYHLDVEKNDMYIASGLLTHNAAYGK